MYITGGDSWATSSDVAEDRMPVSYTRVVVGAMVFPTISTLVGKLCFGSVKSNAQRSLLVCAIIQWECIKHVFLLPLLTKDALLLSSTAMIINLLRLPGSYWLYRERMIYHQAGDSHMVEIPNS